MTATERNNSSRGLSLKSGIFVTFGADRIPSGGGVCGRVGSTHLFLLAGSSGLPPSLMGVDRFREIGEMGAMIAIRDVRRLCVWIRDYRWECNSPTAKQ
jgi:hypothetical protein